MSKSKGEIMWMSGSESVMVFERESESERICGL